MCFITLAATVCEARYFTGMPFKFLPPSPSASLFFPVQFSPHKHCEIPGVTLLLFHHQARPTAFLGCTLALKSLLFLCDGGLWGFFIFFSVSISHIPSKMHPFFCARTKNCLRAGQGVGRRKPEEVTITRILDSWMLYERGGFLLKTWELGILLEPHWLKPLFLAPLIVLSFSRCQDA